MPTHSIQKPTNGVKYVFIDIELGSFELDVDIFPALQQLLHFFYGHRKCLIWIKSFVPPQSYYSE